MNAPLFTLRDRLLAFFVRRPDEELSTADIMLKANVTRPAVLRAARLGVEEGWLQMRTPPEGGPWIVRLSPEAFEALGTHREVLDGGEGE